MPDGLKKWYAREDSNLHIQRTLPPEDSASTIPPRALVAGIAGDKQDRACESTLKNARDT